MSIQPRGPHSVEVEGAGLEGAHILIATGAKPLTLGIPGEEHLIYNEDFLALNLETLPERIVMVGGGYIASEFSYIFARAGAQVIVLQCGDRMLTHFEPELVGWLMESFEAAGIDVRTSAEVTAIGRDRIPRHGLIQRAKRGHRGSHDAKVVVGNLLDSNRHKPDYRGVPSVAFSLPPIAAVGLSEAEAHREGLKFSTKSQKTSDWFTARQTAEPVYGFKVMVENGNERVGAHLVGPHADEVINLFALASRHELTASALKQTMFAYPTGASDIGYML